MNVALITIDSLRYDVANAANTPNFHQLFKMAGVKGWRKAYAHGTYTLLSHISLFHAGITPEDRGCGDVIYDRNKLAAFRQELPWARNKPSVHPVPAADNLVKGFEVKGYTTVGVGGVAWFNTDLPTTRIWEENYFQKFYWHKEFLPKNKSSFKKQIQLSRNVLHTLPQKEKLFYFLNISSTHQPYMNFGKSKEGQQKAFEHVDELFPKLVSVLPRPCHYFIMADHGECFGEDGLWGHGFYHPKVMEVPFVHFVLP